MLLASPSNDKWSPLVNPEHLDDLNQQDTSKEMVNYEKIIQIFTNVYSAIYIEEHIFYTSLQVIWKNVTC